MFKNMHPYNDTYFGKVAKVKLQDFHTTTIITYFKDICIDNDGDRNENQNEIKSNGKFVTHVFPSGIFLTSLSCEAVTDCH